MLAGEEEKTVLGSSGLREQHGQRLCGRNASVLKEGEEWSCRNPARWYFPVRATKEKSVF